MSDDWEWEWLPELEPDLLARWRIATRRDRARLLANTYRSTPIGVADHYPPSDYPPSDGYTIWLIPHPGHAVPLSAAFRRRSVRWHLRYRRVCRWFAGLFVRRERRLPAPNLGPYR